MLSAFDRLEEEKDNLFFLKTTKTKFDYHVTNKHPEEREAQKINTSREANLVRKRKKGSAQVGNLLEH